MRKIYTAIKFNGENLPDFLNASLEASMASDSFRGSRTILKEKIPGRDIPYFYDVEDEALEFELTFALKDPLTKLQIKTLVRKLFNHRTYKTIEFGEYESSVFVSKSPVYKVIFSDELKFEYIGTKVYNNGVGTDKLIGSFTVKALCDRPYGYVYISVTGNDVNTRTVNNTGDLEFFPSIQFTNSGTGAVNNKPIRVKNLANNTTMTFSGLALGEEIFYNGHLKTLSSTAPLIYPRWSRDELELEIGSQTINFEYFDNTWQLYKVAEITISGEAPMYIKLEE